MESKIAFWECGDPEELSNTELDEAVEYYLDGFLFDDLVNLINKRETITVTGYARLTIDEETIRYFARSMLDDCLERLDDEYGDPNGWTEVTEEMKQFMELYAVPFVRQIIKRYNIWRCDPVCEEKINVLDWITENQADWLDEIRQKDHDRKATDQLEGQG